MVIELTCVLDDGSTPAVGFPPPAPPLAFTQGQTVTFRVALYYPDRRPVKLASRLLVLTMKRQPTDDLAVFGLAVVPKPLIGDNVGEVLVQPNDTAPRRWPAGTYVLDLYDETGGPREPVLPTTQIRLRQTVRFPNAGISQVPSAPLLVTGLPSTDSIPAGWVLTVQSDGSLAWAPGGGALGFRYTITGAEGNDFRVPIPAGGFGSSNYVAVGTLAGVDVDPQASIRCPAQPGDRTNVDFRVVLGAALNAGDSIDFVLTTRST